MLLSTGLLSVFYALFSWRSYAERDRYMQQLRPFVASQRLYDHLLEQAQARPGSGTRRPEPAPDAAAAQSTFFALCRTVLDARLAYLVALGPSAPLAGPPLVYPPAAEGGLPGRTLSLAAVAAQAAASQQSFLRGGAARGARRALGCGPAQRATSSAAATA